MRNIYLLLFLAIAISAAAQPYQVGRRSTFYTDAGRSRNVGTELYYPANSAGTNVPLAPGTAAFPVVVFGHGFTIPYGSYKWLGDSLAGNGFIAVFPTTEGSLSPSHEQFGRDLAFLCSRITSLTDSAGSFLFGRVKNRAAVAGHSMGGGSSFLAANYNSAINAIFNFAAAETTPSAKAAAFNVNIPALIFSGSSDCIVRDTNQLRMYTNVMYPCKAYVNISNALHCHFANNEASCVTGQFFSGCNSSPITAPIVFDKTMALLLPWLQYYLQDSCSAKDVFEARLSGMAGISWQRTCSTDPFICTPPPIQYIFTGSGNWTDAANWQNNLIPPSPLPLGSEIIIAATGNNTCILNTPQTIPTGAALTVQSGKILLIQGNLMIQ